MSQHVLTLSKGRLEDISKLRTHDPAFAGLSDDDIVKELFFRQLDAEIAELDGGKKKP